MGFFRRTFPQRCGNFDIGESGRNFPSSNFSLICELLWVFSIPIHDVWWWCWRRRTLFCAFFSLFRWLLLFNSQPIVYFFHYVALFISLQRFHTSHLSIEMNWRDWCNKIAKEEKPGIIFSLFCIENMENHHRKRCGGIWRCVFLRF